MLGMIMSPAISAFRVLGLRSRSPRPFLEKLCHRSSAYIYQWILICLHTNVGYYNISSEIDFQGAGLKVKETVAVFRKTLCYGSSAYI